MMDSQPDHDCIRITCDCSPARSPPRAPTRVVLPAMESVERNASAWIREVRANVTEPRAAQGSS